MAELRANTACLIGQLVTDQPAARHGRDAYRVCGLALSTGILSAPLDPVVSRRILDHPTDCRHRNLPTRMTGCASPPEKQCRVQRQFDMRYACEYRRECYQTQLAGRRRALRGALEEGPIVDQPH